MNECCIPKSSIVDLWSPIRFLLRLGSHVSSVAGAWCSSASWRRGHGVVGRRSDITMRGGIIHPVIKIAHIGY